MKLQHQVTEPYEYVISCYFASTTTSDNTNPCNHIDINLLTSLIRSPIIICLPDRAEQEVHKIDTVFVDDANAFADKRCDKMRRGRGEYYYVCTMVQYNTRRRVIIPAQNSAGNYTIQAEGQRGIVWLVWYVCYVTVCFNTHNILHVHSSRRSSLNVHSVALSFALITHRRGSSMIISGWFYLQVRMAG